MKRKMGLLGWFEVFDIRDGAFSFLWRFEYGFDGHAYPYFFGFDFS